MADLDDQLDEAYQRYQRIRVASWTGILLLAVIALVVGFMPVPFVKLSPGPMYNTIGTVNGIELIKITGTKVYPTEGELNLTTVTERGGPFGGLTLPEAFGGWIDHDQRVVPVEVLYPPGTTAKEALDEQAADFTSSQSAAIAASLTYLKVPVTSQVVVAQVVPQGPSAGKLQTGDVLKSVNGKAVAKPDELPPIVRALPPGSTAKFALTRDGKDMVVDVVLGASPRNPANGYAGIAGAADYSGPFPITFGLEDVGGPSAGLMFTLGIVDKLTPDDLSRGQVVAGTGTMDPAGKVGPIGGIRQKMAAARNNGAALFLAPAENCDEVVGAVPPGLNVAKVGTLAEAVDVLKKWGSGSADLPRCS